MPDSPRHLPRRTVLSAGALGGLAVASTPWTAHAVPLHRGGQRPELTSGIQSGDVDATRATVWTRADRTSRMLVEVSERPDFRHARLYRGPILGPGSDFTGKVHLTGLRPGQDLHYRVFAEDPHRHGVSGRSLTGRLSTVPLRHDDVRFVWSGDLGGQGYGINPEIGGYRIFDAMGRLHPDFYLCNGDNVYADDPIPASQPDPSGGTWHSLTSPAKDKVAETLDEYRGQYRYNLMDHNIRRFYATTPQIQQWDDHETKNNWYPGEILTDPAYTEKRVDVLARRSSRAWHDYTPIAASYDRSGRIYRVVHHGPLLDVFVLDMRSYRDANSPNKQTFNDGGILGFEQAAWLKGELKRSRALWKVISNDMPLTEVVADTLEGNANFEAVSQGDNGQPLGRELQIADLLRFIKHEKIRNTVWLTTDVHYTAAHYFDPDKAAFTDFDPFWQFTSGPLNSGAFPADASDQTFGAQQVFVKAPSTPNSSPATEFQFFGEVDIDGSSEAMRVRLRDNSGSVLWHTVLEPRH